MFSALQSTSVAVTDVVNSVQIDAYLDWTTSTKFDTLAVWAI